MMGMSGTPDPRSMNAGFLFARLLARPDFRQHLAEIGAPRSCPVVAVFEEMELERLQLMIDLAFAQSIQEDGEMAEQIMLVSCDSSEPFGLRIRLHPFENEVCALQKEACQLLR